MADRRVVVRDATTGEEATVIPASRRKDGSVRREIRVRNGYVPPDEVGPYRTPQRRAEHAAPETGSLPAPAEARRAVLRSPYQRAEGGEPTGPVAPAAVADKPAHGSRDVVAAPAGPAAVPPPTAAAPYRTPRQRGVGDPGVAGAALPSPYARRSSPAADERRTVRDAASGEEVTYIPASRRADGSVRKEIRVRPGYVPPDEIGPYRTPQQRAREAPTSAGASGREGTAAAAARAAPQAVAAPAAGAPPRAQGMTRTQKRNAARRLQRETAAGTGVERDTLADALAGLSLEKHAGIEDATEGSPDGDATE